MKLTGDDRRLIAQGLTLMVNQLRDTWRSLHKHYSVAGTRSVADTHRRWKPLAFSIENNNFSSSKALPIVICLMHVCHVGITLSGLKVTLIFSVLSLLSVWSRDNICCNISWLDLLRATAVPPTNFKNCSAFALSKLATILFNSMNAYNPSALPSAENRELATYLPSTMTDAWHYSTMTLYHEVPPPQEW